LLDNRLQTLLAPIITQLGYEFVGVERIPQGKRSILVRVYIDNPNGITLDDCEQVSYHISGRYVLEVSSPGFDRPLFTLEQFTRFIGHKVTIKLSRSLESRRSFTGTLRRVEGQNIVILSEEVEYSLPFTRIDKACLVPENLKF
jgi:ribosome maturation factor RimP